VDVHPRERTAATTLAGVDALLGLLWMLWTWLGGGASDPACLVLGGLDSVRSQAFVSGDQARLRDVYVDGQAARADAEVMRSYRERGLRLEGMLLVREACRTTERSDRRTVLEVIDRLGRTWVRSADGDRRELPHDRPTHRIVVLERTGEVWRVASVRSG
jgi:hypothetical protein